MSKGLFEVCRHDLSGGTCGSVTIPRLTGHFAVEKIEVSGPIETAYGQKNGLMNREMYKGADKKEM